MRKFLIGQYGGFDYRKYHRDYRSDFFGIEACLFGKEEDTLNLFHEAKKEGFNIGVHFPLRASNSKIRDALFMSLEEETRKHAFEWIEGELEYLTNVQPEYVLFHYPKPVIFDERVDWSMWSFDPGEYVWEKDISFYQFKEKSEALFQWLTVKGEEYRFTPVLELDAVNRYIYDTDFLSTMLDRYNRIRLCLDTSRLYIQERTDPFFDSRSFVRNYARYAYLIHLANLRITDRIMIKKHPVLPSLDPRDGWGPIEEYLKIIREENKEVKVLFEHRSDSVSDEELEECYNWVDSILNPK